MVNFVERTNLYEPYESKSVAAIDLWADKADPAYKRQHPP